MACFDISEIHMDVLLYLTYTELISHTVKISKDLFIHDSCLTQHLTISPATLDLLQEIVEMGIIRAFSALL